MPDEVKARLNAMAAAEPTKLSKDPVFTIGSHEMVFADEEVQDPNEAVIEIVEAPMRMGPTGAHATSEHDHPVQNDLRGETVVDLAAVSGVVAPSASVHQDRGEVVEDSRPPRDHGPQPDPEPDPDVVNEDIPAPIIRPRQVSPSNIGLM
jgi:hypothetical protein